MSNNKKGLLKNARSNRGMTLVEVLVALTLLTLIVLVFTPLFMNYYKNLYTAGEITKKTYYRASLMERLVANRGKNDTGYEFEVAEAPITLTDAKASTVSATFGVEGNYISESPDSANAYVTFYSKNTSSSMVCFPASLTDDFLTKDITVVPSGFAFEDEAFRNDGEGSLSSYHFEVFNSDSMGVEQKLDFGDGFYTIDDETDTDGKKVAVFTFRGGNETICFEHSPLIIKYCNGTSVVEKVKVEINAPEIILVGEAAEDSTSHQKNYFYYATAGVDTTTGRMDIVAKKMSGDAALVSAMNDVEWVAKGEGDNGSGGKNEYGYYVMGGDAGQVRRFWKQNDLPGSAATSENYTWAGDYLYNYNSYAKYTGLRGKSEGSETFKTPALTTQAQFKKVVSTDIKINETNDVYTNVFLDHAKNGVKILSFTFAVRNWQAITTNYFTANVTSTDKQKITLGRFLTFAKAKSGGGIDWVANRAGQDIGTADYSGNGLNVSQDDGATKDENELLVTQIGHGGTYGQKLDIDGYKEATGYEYVNDNSLITITSVGAVQINSGSYAPNDSWKAVQDNSSLTNDVYPTQSYTLYCGYIPAVIDMWGRATHGSIATHIADMSDSALEDLVDNDIRLKGDKWQHVGTYGIATDGENWYPTGKFGDRFTTTTALDEDLFPDDYKQEVTVNGQKRDVLKYSKLLNYHYKNDSDFNNYYEAKPNGGEFDHWNKPQLHHYVAHQDKQWHVEGTKTHVISVDIDWKEWSLSWNKHAYNIKIVVTKKGESYGMHYWTDTDDVGIANPINTAVVNTAGNNNRRIAKINWSHVFDAEYTSAMLNDNPGIPYTNDASSYQLNVSSGGNGIWQDGSGKDPWYGNEAAYRKEVVDKEEVQEEDWYYDDPDESHWEAVYTSTSDGIRFYGPGGSAEGTSVTVDGKTAKLYDDVGTALPGQNNSGYLTSEQEVDITLGYLSHPYAIGIDRPAGPDYGSNWIGSDYGSDAIFANGKADYNEVWDHTFFSAGLRDNVTMLDMKTFRDALTNSTFTLAAGYSLSFLFDDLRVKNQTGALGLISKDATYARTASCDQIMNTGIVYLRGTGSGGSGDTKDEEGSMASGKGWTLKKSSNVFHQFYGIDQYCDDNDKPMNIAALGWDTEFHRAYFNIERICEVEVTPTFTINRTSSSDKYGTYCHPLAQTEVKTVNWGLTTDDKPQAMWGTANGTLLSWYFNYESYYGSGGSDIKSQNYNIATNTYSKVNTVTKEFESYMWADRYGNSWTGKKSQFYDYPSQHAGPSFNKNISGDYGFISVLSSINDVCCSDNVWVAVGNQSGKDPSQYCASNHCYVQSSGLTSGAGNAGSFVNVKYTSTIDETKCAHWIAVKVSDAKNVNFLSVVNCQGVWYIMGYIDADGDGKNDANEQAVMYWSVRPEQGFNRCITRCGAGTGNSDYSSSDTYAVYYEGETFHSLELDGVNKMACQS